MYPEDPNAESPSPVSFPPNLGGHGGSHQPNFSQPVNTNLSSDQAVGKSNIPEAPQQPTAHRPMVDNQPPANIKAVDMPEEMKAKAVELGRQALKQELDSVNYPPSPRAIAGRIKKEFDRLYGPAWHCIVGRSFGSFVTHGKSKFSYSCKSFDRGSLLHLLLHWRMGHHALQDCINLSFNYNPNTITNK